MCSVPVIRLGAPIMTHVSATKLIVSVRKTATSWRRAALIRIFMVVVGIGVTSAAHSDTVLELFTSHGCSSCPPAEALLKDLQSENESLIALEFHVDYWNSLVHGNAGNFVDPYSQSAFSERQRGYASRKLKGRRGVYTPQAIVNGQYALVGSNRGHANAAIAKSLDSGIKVSIKRNDGSWRITVDNTSEQASDALVWLVRFHKSVTTDITGGENKGLVIENHNVVTSMDAIGGVPKTDTVVLSATLDTDPNMGCAVIIQDSFLSPILAAAKCPG